MAERVNRRIVLARRPVGMPDVADFALVASTAPTPAEGEVLCRTRLLSLDPYMRGRMNTLPLAATMIGSTVADVVESRDPSISVGDVVLCNNGWQEYGAAPAASVRKLDPDQAPVSTALGILGMPGMTAYVGLLDVGRARPGETVVVSAAAGAVGSVVGQLARLNGCRAVGVAGSADKCAYVVEELGFDACVNLHEAALGDALALVCPDGIDVYFDNVAGAVLAAVLPLLNARGRVALCGMISQYNAVTPQPGPNLYPLLAKDASIQGFHVGAFAERQAAFLAECSAWLREGRLRYREDSVDGLEQAPAAFLRLFTGDNFGKLLVRLGGDQANAH